MRPTGTAAAGAIVILAGIDVGLGARIGPALGVVVPLVVFLGAALTLAGLVERTGLADRAAAALVELARGRVVVVYLAVCLASAVLTAVVSLDGAVVLLVPLLLVLANRYRAPFGPLFLGAVAVANTASVAVPQGNPTNLVLMRALGIGPAAFLGHMLVPGLAATAFCAAVVAGLERRSLATRCIAPARRPRTRLSPPERRALVTLAVAAAVAWVSPVAGIAPWWPFAVVVGAALLVPGQRVVPALPWRIAAQVGGLVVTVEAVGLGLPSPPGSGLVALLAVALCAAAASGLANNLPASALAGSVLTAGPAGYAAVVGLAVGALATPQGSVATLLAQDLSRGAGPVLSTRRLALVAVPATVVAVLVLVLTGDSPAQ